MFKKTRKHMDGPRQSVAEEFRLSQEAKFASPPLEKMYWKNPNAQRGSVARCSYSESGIGVEHHYTEGN